MFMMPLWRGHSIRDSGFGIWDSGLSWDSRFGISGFGARDDPLASGLVARFTRLEGAKQSVRQFADLRRQPCEFFHARRVDVSTPFADERFGFQFRMLAKCDRHAIDI